MTTTNDIKARAQEPKKTHAEHGAQSEVTWGEGAGRQPYANQEGADEMAASHETEEGDRGELSGNSLDQLDRVKGTPGSHDVQQHQQHDDDERNTKKPK